MNDIFKRRSFLALPANITHLPRIKSFSPLGPSKDGGIRNLTMILENGAIISGFDEVCTGSRTYPYAAENIVLWFFPRLYSALDTASHTLSLLGFITRAYGYLAPFTACQFPYTLEKFNNR